MSKKIALLGIERDNKGITHTEGSCNELVGLCNKDGVWVPCVVGQLISTVSYLEFIYHHHVLNGGYLYGQRSPYDGGLVISIKKDTGSTSTIMNFSSNETVKSVKHIGNMLYLHIVKSDDSRIVRLLWDGIKYVDVSSIPDVPEITSVDLIPLHKPSDFDDWDADENGDRVSFDVDENVDDVLIAGFGCIEENGWFSIKTNDLANDPYWLEPSGDRLLSINKLRDMNHYFVNSYFLYLKYMTDDLAEAKSIHNNQIQHYKSEKYYNGFFFCAIAYEMYDGTYIKGSNPMLIQTADYTMDIVDNTILSSVNSIIDFSREWSESYQRQNIITSDTNISTRYLYWLPGVYKHTINMKYTVPDEYSSLIKNIAIVASPLYADYYNYAFGDADEDTDNFVFIGDEFSNNDIIDNVPLYVIDRLPIDYGTEKNKEFTFDYSHFENIRNGELFSIDDNQSNLDINLSRSGSFGVYNKRFILNGVSFKFPDFDFNQLSLVSDIGKTVYAIVELNINNVLHYVINAIIDMTLKCEGDNEDVFNMLFFYPDNRAQRIRFITKEDGVEKLIFKKTMTVYGNYTYVFGQFNIISQTDSVDNYLAYGTLLEQNDTMRISKVNNPFVFPTLNSFTFDGDIVGSAVATHATSDGQFGQYPLNVLHGEGINALEVGSGDIAFSRDIPLSREVCTNPDSIHGSEIGILFADRDGLKLLNGRNIVLLTEKIDSAPEVGIRDDLNYKLFTGESGEAEMLARFPSIDPLLSTDSVIEYLQDAKVVYLGTKEKNILITNENKSYSYVVSLRQNMVYKVKGSYKYLEDAYTKVYALDGTHLLNLSGSTTDEGEVFFETNPLSLQEYDWAINRIILRGLLDATHATLVSGLYIYGSMDEKHWTKLNHYQINTKRKDIALSFTGAHFKWIKIVFSGWLNQGSYISHLEFVPVAEGKDNIS